MRALKTKDIFPAIRLINSANLKEDFTNIVEKSSNKKVEDGEAVLEEEIGYDIIFSIMEKIASTNTEKALYNFLAGPFEKTPEEIANTDIMEIGEEILSSGEVENWKNFFTRVSSLMTKTK